MTPKTAPAATSLVETYWGARIVASAFVLLASGLSWMAAATAMVS